MAGRMPLHNVVLLGCGGVGKSKTAERYHYRYFCDVYDPHQSDEYTEQVVIDGQACVVGVIVAMKAIESASDEEKAAILREFILLADAIVFMYSITSRNTYSNVKYFYDAVKRTLQERTSSTENEARSSVRTPIEHAGPPMILVGNKTDVASMREVSKEEGQQFAEELGVEFIEVSALTGHNVDTVFETMVRMLRTQQEKASLPPPEIIRKVEPSKRHSWQFWKRKTAK